LETGIEAAVAALILNVIVLASLVVRNYIKARFTPQQVANAASWAQTAVRAAEVFGKDYEGDGQQKYFVASQALEAMAKRYGVQLHDEEVWALVHAALDELRHEQEVRDGTIEVLKSNAFLEGYQMGMVGEAQEAAAA